MTGSVHVVFLPCFATVFLPLPKRLCFCRHMSVCFVIKTTQKVMHVSFWNFYSLSGFWQPQDDYFWWKSVHWLLTILQKSPKSLCHIIGKIWKNSYLAEFFEKLFWNSIHTLRGPLLSHKISSSSAKIWKFNMGNPSYGI